MGKPGSVNGLLPDVLKCCGRPLLDYLQIVSYSLEGEMCALSVECCSTCPVPKKRDLSFCDNWRGISLLDMMGKLFARVLNDRLQLVVEEAVSDSQCRFRAGRGYVDMIICVHQLVEKAIEYNTKLFL